jgi:hypothetical protein
VEDLIAPLRERSKPIETLWLRARVAVRRSSYLGQGIFDATVLAQPPDRIRLRAYSSATILMFELLADGKGLRLHDTIKDRYYAAEYGALRQANSLWAGFSPSLLIQALAVEQTVLDRATSARSASTYRRWKTIELRLESAEDRMCVDFDRTGQQIVGLTYERPSDKKPMRVRYGEMAAIAEVRLPRWVEIEIGSLRSRMRLDVFEYKVNQPFGPTVFSLEAPPGRTWLPLEILK